MLFSLLGDRDFRLALASARASLPWAALNAPGVASSDAQLHFLPTEIRQKICLASARSNPSPSLKPYKKQSIKYGLFFICSGTGIRTPIDWTKTSCPTIRRSPIISRRSLGVGGIFNCLYKNHLNGGYFYNNTKFFKSKVKISLSFRPPSHLPTLPTGRQACPRAKFLK